MRSSTKIDTMVTKFKLKKSVENLDFSEIIYKKNDQIKSINNIIDKYIHMMTCDNNFSNSSRSFMFKCTDEAVRPIDG